MKRLLFAICVALAILKPSTAQTFVTGSILSGGLTREYRMYIPASYIADPAPAPLLINLHGYGSNNLEQDFYANFRGIADTARFIVVLPNGTFDNQGKRYWNTFANPTSVNDLGFIADLIDTLSTQLNVDRNRVYSTGMSNGGFMSYDLACSLSSRIAAIASVTGTMTNARLDNCFPTRPVPVMQVHGTADNVVAYNGSSALDFASIPKVVDFWIGHNHCSTTASVYTIPNTVVNDGCTAEHYIYGGGNQGSEVQLFKIQDGGHTWPGAAINVGVTNQDFNASLEIWRFLSRFSLSPSTPVTETGQNEIRLYPNPAIGANQIIVEGGEINEVVATDEWGRIVYCSLGLSESEINIPLAKWVAGVYSVRIRTNKTTVVKRFVCLR